MRDEQLKVLLLCLHPCRRRHPHGARAVPMPGRSTASRYRAISRSRGSPPTAVYRDLRRDLGRAQQLALGRRPFYLRTGKRMQEWLAEVVVNFREVPHALFGHGGGDRVPNRLVIRLQPDGEPSAPPRWPRCRAIRCVCDRFLLNLDSADTTAVASGMPTSVC